MKNYDKSTNKDYRITVRLTPFQNFELSRLADELSIPKAKLVRYFIDDFLKKYNNADT